MTASTQPKSGGEEDPTSSSPIFQAIAKDDPDQLSKALAVCTSYSDLDVCDSSDETPLMKAAWCKGQHKKRILQLLWVRHLQLSASFDSSDNKNNNLQETLQRKDDDGFNLLAHAAFHGDDDMLELVLGFYKQSFDNLSFVKDSISSADLTDDEKKKLTKAVGNCLARIPPVAVQNQINNYYKAKAIQEEPQPPPTSKGDDDVDDSSSDEEDDDDDDKTPKRTNALPGKNSVPAGDSDDEESSSDGDAEADNDNAGNKFASSLRADQRDEVLTTIHCMKTLAVPLHDGMKKGRAGPTEVAKMEAIMMLMGSIEEMLKMSTGG